MIDTEKTKQILEQYKTCFVTRWPDEMYKWQAVAHFQKHWDIEAENFAEMWKESVALTSNLLVSAYYYPSGMIYNFAVAAPEETRAMFRALYDESNDLAVRIQAFMDKSAEIRKTYGDSEWRSDYQNSNAISTYLWLRYPEKYYIYKFSVVKAVAGQLDPSVFVKGDSKAQQAVRAMSMYDEIRDVLAQDQQIKDLLSSALDDSCDPDRTLHTLTVDFAYYLCNVYLPGLVSDEDWFPKDYEPGISKDKWIELLKNGSVFSQNALTIVKRMKDYGGEATCKQLATKYGEKVNFYNSGSTALAKRIMEATGCAAYETDTEELKYWPILYTGKRTTGGNGVFTWKLRQELSDALDVYTPDVQLQASVDPKNPNYWWLTANPKMWSYSELKVGEEQSYTLYNDNGNKRRIFQHFLDVKKGDRVICYEANPVKKIVALGMITQGSDGKCIYFTKTEGLSSPIDYSTIKDCPELAKMEFLVSPNGSLFKLTKGEYAFLLDLIREENPIRPVVSAVEKYTREDFLDKVFMGPEKLDVLVNLLRYKKNVILQGAPGVGKTFVAKKLAYVMMGEVDDSRIEFVQFHQNYSYEDFIMGYRPDENGFKLQEGIFYRFCQTAANHPEQEYFFIIDEINRGNMSKIFGELMMLIEKDYRGTKATLAYNGLPFYVPENLYLIGMMNTADRSLAMIDYALRRRFSFFEMEPGFDSQGFLKMQKELKNETFDALIEQIRQLNKEIAKDSSLGRGFRIGHSYFCLGDERVCTLDWMQAVVEFEILPLLQEYWFDEPEKVLKWENNLHGVFNDQ